MPELKTISGSAAAQHLVKRGTTAERIAFGLTLGLTDACIWTDTTQNTIYAWNGTEWV